MDGSQNQQNQHNNPNQQWKVPKRVSRERKIEARDEFARRSVELKLQQLQLQQQQQHQSNH